MIRGVDVSQFQGDINWGKVARAGYHFAVVKASEGLDFRDHRFNSARVKAVRKAGIVLGFYHFARPQRGRSGAAEARWFHKVVEGAGGRKSGDLPYVLDLEWSSGLTAAQVLAWSDDFCAEVKRLTGRGCIVYTGGFYKNLGRVRAPKQGGVLWVAHYGVSKPSLPAGWKHWAFWQYSDRGKVPGISGGVDLDYFNGTVAALRALATDKKAAKPKAAATVEHKVPHPEKPAVFTDGEATLVNQLLAARAQAKKVGSWEGANLAYAENAKAKIGEQIRAIKAEAAKSKSGLSRGHRRERIELLYAAISGDALVYRHTPTSSGGRPAWLPAKYHAFWDKPWDGRGARSGAFRSLLERHGYLSPNFTKAEAKCKNGTPIPASLNTRARDHAFKMEKLRHACGDVPIPIVSWYRTPAYNRQVGGASQSQHIYAIATDLPREWVDKAGRAKVLNAMYRIWANGGVGVYPGGNVHADSRHGRARWSSWTPAR